MRIFCHWLQGHPIMGNFILVCIIISSALLAAGRAHTVLPLSGVTHMTPQEVVAENLKLLQVDFLRTHLGA